VFEIVAAFDGKEGVGSQADYVIELVDGADVGLFAGAA
jgi:hypothetical protein